ncbi:uncharacterized protein PGTG_06230 [Puccinia graminis f. sp. tritici CRL 75-36-700-3]|uniref:Uncharacterized protein n=1 Tax=Puccinia graminis f. sp. tritici (strain CRL 75-36-700-3 / race SCCL) TaxID=418459 RepID=E3K7F0_PUCGT|nr:uncharacterized protein PGTG_06230 [Puccinia graminis f. sp. tritici CRL 75-36-700-3]EFP80274.2 hypothetical protein PGTG_06230 [Puccinia graminis f. sp. tritici CRL 75-36-700-3]
MPQNHTTPSLEASDRYLATLCGSKRVDHLPSTSGFSTLPLESPHTALPSPIDTRYCFESSSSISPSSASSSTWTSPSTNPFWSPPKSEKSPSASSVIATNRADLIDDLSSTRLAKKTSAVSSTDLTSFFAPSNTADSAKSTDVQCLARENPITRCLSDLHLLQTPLRSAFQEVFDSLSDDAPEPVAEIYQCDDETVNCSQTPSDVSLTQSDVNSLVISNSQSLEETRLSTSPCSLKRCPARVKRSSRERSWAPPTIDLPPRPKALTQPKSLTRPKALTKPTAPLSGTFVFDRAFIRQTRHFKYWTAILDAPPSVASSSRAG